jgi:hypothetical protein
MAYQAFQQVLSEFNEDRTPSLQSTAASQESAKESPNVERGDR